MQIKPKSNVLLVQKNEGTELIADMFVAKDDSDKNLLTCTVISGDTPGKIVITGQYSLYKLIYKGADYYFLDKDDVIGTVEEDE